MVNISDATPSCIPLKKNQVFIFQACLVHICRIDHLTIQTVMGRLSSMRGLPSNAGHKGIHRGFLNVFVFNGVFSHHHSDHGYCSIKLASFHIVHGFVI